jgi:sialic acid synthase SpsE
MAAGHVLTETDLALLRPASGIEPKHFEAVQGRVLARAVAAGSPLMWDDLA